MNSRFGCIILCLASLTWAQVAIGQIKGSLYVDADAGISFLQDTTAHSKVGSLPFSAGVRFNPGYRADLAVGYLVPEGAALNFRGAEAVCNFAIEFNTGLIFNPVSEFGRSFSWRGSDADFYQVPLVVNGIVSIPFSERFSVSLGMGIGAAVTMMSVASDSARATGIDVGLVYQGLARLAYKLNPHLEVSAFGKVLGSPATTFPDEPFRQTGVEPLRMDGPLSVSGGIGLSYLF